MSAAPPPYPGTDGQYPPPGQGPPYPTPEKGGQPQPQPGGYPTQQQPLPGYYPPGQAPPPAQYAQPGQPGYSQSSTVVVTQPVVTTAVVQHYRESPIQTTCPHCQAQVITAVHYETGTLTWLICVILCLVGCNLGCCFIPFCVDGCKDVIHTCPNCRQLISRWSRM